MESGLPRFPRHFTCAVVLKNTGQGGSDLLRTRLSLSSAALSRVLLLNQSFVTPRRDSRPASLCLTTPAGHWPVCRYLPCGFGLFPVRSPLLREWSLFLRVLRCFSSPGSLPPINRRVPRLFIEAGYPIRRSPAKLARQLTEAYRSRATSFIGPQRLGIHRAPLVALTTIPLPPQLAWLGSLRSLSIRLLMCRPVAIRATHKKSA